MLDLQLELLERTEDGEECPQLTSNLRALQRTATLLERRLNAATRHLVRHVEPSPEITPSPPPPEEATITPEVTPPPPPPEETTAEPQPTASGRPPAAVVALALVWTMLTGRPALAAPDPSTAILPSYGVYGGVGAVLATSGETVRAAAGDQAIVRRPAVRRRSLLRKRPGDATYLSAPPLPRRPRRGAR